MIIIGSARISEKNSINGQRGDQTGKECSTQEYYDHNKGWVVLRAKEEEMRNNLAYSMKAICDNDCFGYGQDDRLSGYAAASKVGFDPAYVTEKVNIDCSEAVRVCCGYAGLRVPDFYTGNEVDVLMQTGCFDKIDNCKADDLKKGDILVTKIKGHTAIVTEVEGLWEQIEPGQWVYHVGDELLKDQWEVINHHWYYFGEDGIMKSGWQVIKGEWYYLEENNNEGYQGALWHSDAKGSQSRWYV